MHSPLPRGCWPNGQDAVDKSELQHSGASPGWNLLPIRTSLPDTAQSNSLAVTLLFFPNTWGEDGEVKECDHFSGLQAMQKICTV